ncbi:(2Fe-2S)-binding protein, partial [bacterium]|nr:(2Fe-2S)-binding protein [bacterium]
PGMILATKVLLDKEKDPTLTQIREALSGNLCRCTGYVKIENAVIRSAEKMRSE